MASKKTVSIDNLAALGAQRLATLLFELADSHPEIKRRLRLELAAEGGGDIIAAQISKRLMALRKARSFIDWQKRKSFLMDLDLQRMMISERVFPSRPDLALDLMARFMDLAEPVMSRIDDSHGATAEIFSSAGQDFARIAAKVQPDPVSLADQLFAVISADVYTVFDGLIAAVFPVLGESGISRLKGRLSKAMTETTTRPDRFDWQLSTHRRALQTIADCEGDVDAYVALMRPEDRVRPAMSAQIAHRLLAAGRAAEALETLQQAKPKPRAGQAQHPHDPFTTDFVGGGSWEDIYFEALDATGQPEEAQRLRWAAFEQRLSSHPLRAYLKNLSDFDDVEAEQRAMQHALGFRSFSMALEFFVHWPDPIQAAQLILTRAAEIDGNLYEIIIPHANHRHLGDD